VRLAFFISPVLVLWCAMLASAQMPAKAWGAGHHYPRGCRSGDNNAKIAAADHAWSASAHVRGQAGAWPIPKGGASRSSQLWAEAPARSRGAARAGGCVPQRHRGPGEDNLPAASLSLPNVRSRRPRRRRSRRPHPDEVSKKPGMGSQAEVLQANWSAPSCCARPPCSTKDGEGCRPRGASASPADSPDIIPGNGVATPSSGCKRPVFKAAKQNATLTADNRTMRRRVRQLDAAKAIPDSDFSSDTPFPDRGELSRMAMC